RNIENGLTRLAEDPYDSEALWEIRRNAHTFKGSAGIVGLKQLSEIAHKIEDLLDSMNETGRISGDGVLKLLQDAATCLRDLVYGNNMP
ncbi:Hpt domain-containing protein, partial [Escherichia coli]|nr:Hpt domain-containing protein [Escherichia coli]